MTVERLYNTTSKKIILTPDPPSPLKSPVITSIFFSFFILSKVEESCSLKVRQSVFGMSLEDSHNNIWWGFFLNFYPVALKFIFGISKVGTNIFVFLIHILHLLFRVEPCCVYEIDGVYSLGSDRVLIV